MTKSSAPLYSIRHRDAGRQLAEAIDKGRHRAGGQVIVFFRADDIGIPSASFQLLIDCFRRHRMPLCLAAVPSWITAGRFDRLCRLTGRGSTQWCWHQHGRIHQNFEPEGKKQEFGPYRSEEDIFASLQLGKLRLENIMGRDFQPFFTPPWNRCSAATIKALVKLHYSAISRSCNAEPETGADLPDFQVNVDLHTRKEISPHQGFENLLNELEKAVSSGQCGIMIHHQKMNRNALGVLELLLGTIKSRPQLTPLLFGDMLNI
jgi:hypothetical protein